ncbi:uncharacterized protein LOC111260362 isoform X1 [Varroa jacobsoni]|uniref:uncharacterized protein LOC111260362 isoform X1 n=1 Tax=Varroa jacobsoni TaxID=62625 RepID=UPI000BF9A20E|nr:uncharacterized protein LOC111260362 isoform X1 [Varroa jacobsoni]
MAKAENSSLEYEQELTVVISLRAGRSPEDIIDFLGYPEAAVNAIANQYAAATAADAFSTLKQKVAIRKKTLQMCKKGICVNFEQLNLKVALGAWLTINVWDNQKLQPPSITSKNFTDDDCRMKSKARKVFVPPVNDSSSSEVKEFLQESSDQYKRSHPHNSTEYSSRRKSDPRLPDVRHRKVPRQEQQGSSTMAVSSEQLPIPSVTVANSARRDQSYSKANRIRILNRRRSQPPSSTVGTSLDYFGASDTQNAELESAIKDEIKEEVVDPENGNQQFVMATEHEQQVICNGAESWRGNGLPDFVLSHIKQEIKSEILDEVAPEAFDDGLTHPVVIKTEPKDNDENLLGI